MSARTPKTAAIAPATITDRTCLDVCGLEPRPWKIALRTLGVPHAKVGKRTICSAAAWLVAVDRAAGAEASAPALSDADVIARAIGVRR